MSLKQNTSNGFTLIEMVIAMTILALVVTVLYLAFSTAGRIWSRQQIKGGRGEHEVALARLLSDDLHSLVPYRFSWEKGEGFFFALEPQVLFYATTSGYGARQRSAGGLYFACCYLQKSQEKEGFALYLIKEMGPKKFLLEALSDVIHSPKKSLLINEVLSNSSLLILDGLTDASFAAVGNIERLNLPEGEIEEGALIKSGVISNWSRKTLPESILFRYEIPEIGKRNLFLALVPPPELPSKKDDKKK